MPDPRTASACYRSAKPLGSGAADACFDEQGGSRLPGPVGSRVSTVQREMAVCPRFRYIEGNGLSNEMQDAPQLCVTTTLCEISPEAMAVLAWLRDHAGAIVCLEGSFRVDRRAIAGAVAWEALENIKKWRVPGWRSSTGKAKIHIRQFYKVPLLNRSIPGPRSGPFVAKQVEEAGYLPKLTDEQRDRELATDRGALKYVAAIMAAGADLAEKHGHPIRHRPDLLAQMFHGYDLSQWEELLKKKPSGERLRPGTPMALWVLDNLQYLEDGVGKPDKAGLRNSTEAAGR